MLGYPVSHEAGARQLHHRADGQVQVVRLLVGDHLLEPLAHLLELVLVGHQRHHHLEQRRLARLLAHCDGGADDRAHLHHVHIRLQHA